MYYIAGNSSAHLRKAGHCETDNKPIDKQEEVVRRECPDDSEDETDNATDLYWQNAPDSVGQDAEDKAAEQCPRKLGLKEGHE